MSAKRTERFIERQTEGSAVLGDAGKKNRYRRRRNRRELPLYQNGLRSGNNSAL